MRPILAVLVAFALAGCGRGERQETRTPAGPVIHSVRFGASPDQLLLTVCGADGATSSDPCAVLVTDLATDTAVRIDGPPGRSLAYPTRGPDGGIVATMLDVATDAAGNARSSLVAFPADGAPVARTLVSANRALLHPDVFDGKVYAFLQKCRAKTDRYCEHEVVRVEDGRLRLATPRGVGLGEAKRIVVGGGEPVVWGNFPSSVLFTEQDFIGYAGSTAVWRLSPTAPFGIGRLSEKIDLLAAAPDRSGNVVALVGGQKQLGLDRLSGGSSVRLVDYPGNFPWEGRGLVDMDVAPTDHSAALLWGTTADDPIPKLAVYNAGKRSWRLIGLPRTLRRVSIALEPRMAQDATAHSTPAPKS